MLLLIAYVPMMEIMMMIGSNSPFRISTILAKSLYPAQSKDEKKDIREQHASGGIPERCGVSIISMGPGLSPWIYKAPMITAVTASPGIPSVSIGMYAPPMAALFAVSGAMTPSYAPSPNGRDGFFTLRRAWP